MTTIDTKPIEVKPNGTKPKQTETAVTVRFPLPMAEAMEMAQAYVHETYGLYLDIDDLNRSGEMLVITGMAKAKR